MLVSGIGLPDVAKHASGADAELPRDAFDAAALHRKIVRCRPRILAFTGKHAARAGRVRCTRVPDYGEQQQRIAGTRAFVLPSPPGQARGFWSEAPWRELAAAAGRRQDDAHKPRS